MSKQQKHHKQYDNENSYNNYISENCYHCGIELINIEEILVDVDKDVYICHECAEELNIKTIPCFDLCNYMCGD